MELLDQEGETVTVSMTTAQLMGLYCLSKRKQALGHLFGGGIRITDIETRGKLRKKTIKQDEHYKMDDQMLGRLLSQLTPEQIAVADKLQNYMTEQGSKWGNEVTMKRFGYRVHGEDLLPHRDRQPGPAFPGRGRHGGQPVSPAEHQRREAAGAERQQRHHAAGHLRRVQQPHGGHGQV